MFKTLKENVADIFFGLFYYGLFVMQMLPHFAVMFAEPMTIQYVIMWVVGVAAMITQAIKFPCFTVRIWNAAMIGATVAAFIMKGMM